MLESWEDTLAKSSRVVSGLRLYGLVYDCGKRKAASPDVAETGEVAGAHSSARRSLRLQRQWRGADSHYVQVYVVRFNKRPRCALLSGGTRNKIFPKNNLGHETGDLVDVL